MIDQNKVDNETRWIKPLAVFDARIISGYRIEIPRRVYVPLGIGERDVIEVAFASIGANTVMSTNTVVGVRNRINLRKSIADASNTKIGDIVTVGILTVYHSRKEELVIVFDPNIIPEWYDDDAYSS